MKLMIDDAVWGFGEIFSDFGEIVTLPGRQIDRQSLLRLRHIDCKIENNGQQGATPRN